MGFSQLPGAANLTLPPVLAVREYAEMAALAGNGFFSGTGELVLSAAGNVRITLQNPSTSVKTLHIYGLSVFGTAVGFAELLVNPSGGLPVGARKVNNLDLASGTASVAVLNADINLTTPLSGGVDSGVSVGIPNGSHADYKPYLTVPPGITLGLAGAFTGSANVTATVYWYEI